MYFMDEARFGQQGSLARKWAPTGTRPTAVKQTKYEWVYLYAAVEPATGESTALIAPNVNTGTMNAFLRMLSDDVAATGSKDDVAVVIMDQAGWHTSNDLEVPDGPVHDSLGHALALRGPCRHATETRFTSSLRPL